MPSKSCRWCFSLSTLLKWSVISWKRFAAKLWSIPSVVVKLNFSQPRDVVLIKSTNLESWNNWSFCSVKITKKKLYTLTSYNYTTNSAHNFYDSSILKCLHSAYLYLVFNSKPDCCDVVNFVVSTYYSSVFIFVVPQI